MTFIILSISITSLYAGSNNKRCSLDGTTQTVRFEHLALNVTDPVQTAKWYCDNLGFKIIRQGAAPTYTTFVTDSGANMMFEFFYNAEFPILDFIKLNYMSIHVAFSCEDIAGTKEKLIANGATVAEDLRKTDSGDQVLMLRDPLGLPIQFVQRVKPMLKHSGLFFEHLAFNLDDSRVKAKWFTDNLGMKVMREGGAPNYGMFIADADENMMLELYQNKDFPIIDFSEISHMSIHLAFMVDDMEAIKEKLLSDEAKLVDDINKTPGGDYILMLRDPWNLPVQFAKRAEPMLK